MAKQILTIEAKCVNVIKRTNGGNVVLAVDIKNDDKTNQQTARKAVNILTHDLKDLEGFEPNKKYTIIFQTT